MGALRALRALPKSVLIGGTIFILICLVLALAPWVAPYDPAAQVLSAALAGSSPQHWLGTDDLGRDVLSRLIFGGRFSVTIAAMVLVFCGVTGTVIGALSARVGGVFDEIVMRICDILFSFPDILVAVILIAILRPGFMTLVLALTIAGWAPFARLSRGMTLEVNTKEFIEAAEALGCSRAFIIRRHVIPNIFGPVFAMALLRFPGKLIAVGSLSYLGLGVQPPNSDWGSMIADAQPYVDRVPLLLLGPALAIFVTALAVTVAGQGLVNRRPPVSVAASNPQPIPAVTATGERP